MGDNTAPQSADHDDFFAPPPPPSNTDYRHARWPRLSAERGVRSAPSSSRAEPRPTHPELNPKSKACPERSERTQNLKSADSRRVVVVGVCSSGKSTLVRMLQEKGYRARTCAQEHSHVPHLWQRSHPDVLVYLDASLPTIRRRRKARWPQSLLDAEHQRLGLAREQCNLYVHTDGLAPEDVASKVITFLNNNRSMRDE